MDTLKSMRMFAAIAENGSLSAVARDWGVAPSTISYGLHALEDRLGAQLVFRTTRRLSLTDEGQRFLIESRRILADVDEVMTGLSDREGIKGNIRITCTNDLGRQRIAPLVDLFMREHPNVTVELFLHDRVIDLIDGGFDLAIRTGPLQASELKARLLLRGTKSICASPGYWARQGKPTHPDDLARHNCLMLSEPGERHALWRFRRGEEEIRVRVSGDRQVNDGEALRQWAIAGAGVVQKSSFDIAGDIRNGLLETALEDFTTAATNLYAVAPSRQHSSTRATAFVDFLLERMSQADRS